MIYFLSAVQLLFLLITVSSKQCRERNVVQVTGGIKESSQNGYNYGIISTPNFPQKFSTPFNISYVIDASYQSDDSQINVYLTQMYLSRGVRFFQSPTYEFCDQGHILRGPRNECHKAADQHEQNKEIIVDNLHDSLLVSTSCPYLEIEVTVPDLYGYHYRTRDPFQFDIYGFNITFEIVPEKLGPKNDSCYPRNCSNLGHCYLAENWRDFFCDCSKDHPGRFCEFSPHCDPENNITFCNNSGKCRILGSGDGYCDCSGTGYTGAKCEKRNEQPKVSARTGCSDLNECPLEESKPQCSPETSKGPCSCRPASKSGRVIPTDWVKFETIISIRENYTMLPNQSTIGYELQKNISDWFQANNLSDLHNVRVSFDPPPHEESHLRPLRPERLQIHFHGPEDLEDKVRPLLHQYLFIDRSTYLVRRQIPLIRNSMKLLPMPRVKYKSIEVTKDARLRIGKSASFTCYAVTGSSNYFSQRDIHIRWFKDGLPVNTSIATRHMTIFQTPTVRNETMSILIIDNVSAYDGGLYTCEITDQEFGDQECVKKEVEVIQPPQIEIEPMSLTLEKRKLDRGVVITCTDGSYSRYNPHNKSTEFVWFRSGSSKEVVKNDKEVVSEDIIPQGKLLRILEAENSESFTCTGFNKDGEEKSKIVDVKVLDSKNSPACKQHWEPLLKQTEKENKLWWEWTAPNSVAKKPCPKGFTGYIQRPCILSTSTGKVQWGRSDFSRCISERLKRVNLTLQNAMRGFGDWQTSNGIRLMSQLERYLNANQVLYPGEGEKIIAIMEDIAKYVFHKGKVSDTLFQVFFGTVVKLLKIPNSCVQEKSVLTLCRIIQNMAIRGAMHATANDIDKLLKPHVVSSEVLMLQTLPINATAKYRELSYLFPQKDALMNSTLVWLRDKLRVNFPLDSGGLRGDGNSQTKYYLIMAAYKNVSSLLVPTDAPLKRVAGVGKKSFRTSIELISPVIQISIPDGYYLPAASHIKIHFNLSKEHRSLVSRSPMALKGRSLPAMKGTFYSCGDLDNSSLSTKTDHGRLRWTMNACVMDVQHNSYVECQCEKGGIFGLLKVSNLEDEIPEVNNDVPRIIIAGFSFCILSCVLSATILCVYLKCRISLSSLYALKLFDCLFIFSAVFIVLLGRTEIPSASWLVWSASSCSFLISSLSVQVTKALRVLLMEATPNLPAFIFPWLRNVSQITLLSAIIFSTVLPVWTATVAKLVGENSSNESAFQETSFVFIIFMGTVGTVVLVFFVIYYNAVVKTKSELEGCRQQNACSANNAFTSEMIWVLTYRMKTLNRSFSLTVLLLVMTLGIVLYENLRQSLFIQYFLGFSATAMGIVVFLSYASHSEYPIYLSMCKPEKPFRSRDPEKDAYSESKGSQRKLYAISNEVTGNGSIVGTTGLLPPPPPSILRNTNRQLGDESETQSVSTVEEQSMDTFSTEMSFRTQPPPSGQNVAAFTKRSTRSMKSNGSNNTRSSNGSCRRDSRRNSENERVHPPVPVRGQCYISDYVLPSNPNTSLHDRPSVQIDSSATTNGSYNYLPIRDQNEIQKKISQDLSFLLHDK